MALYHGEGIQHIALGSSDIYRTVESLRQSGVVFLDTPDTYYELLDKRLPDHGEDVPALFKNKILVDGAPGGGLLLQIFTQTVIGPIFFEIIQRKGDEGFGEGNFKALFESMRTGPDAPRRADQHGQGLTHARCQSPRGVANTPPWRPPGVSPSLYLTVPRPRGYH